MLDYANSDPEFLNIVTSGDGLWVYVYDPGAKVQSSQWKHSTSPRPKKARQVRNNVKVMLTVFFDSLGAVHHECAPQGQNIKKEYYVEVLRRLRDAVRCKRPDLWTTGTWQLHHDNAPAHSSQLIQTCLAKHDIPVVRQAPYSPDMASCDFWLFTHLKTQLKSARFESRNDITRNTTAKLYSFRKEAFQKCFEQWRNRCEKCVQSQRDYFEGD
jgi:hypothetical protein